MQITVVTPTHHTLGGLSCGERDALLHLPVDERHLQCCRRHGRGSRGLRGEDGTTPHVG